MEVYTKFDTVSEIPIKTLQVWMGHADTKLIMEVYTKLTNEKEQIDAAKLNDFFNHQRDLQEDNTMEDIPSAV